MTSPKCAWLIVVLAFLAPAARALAGAVLRFVTTWGHAILVQRPVEIVRAGKIGQPAGGCRPQAQDGAEQAKRSISLLSAETERL